MPPPFDLLTDSAGRLVLRRPDHDDVVDVRLRRAFPWSAAETFISLRNREGKEVLLIDSLAALPTPLADRVRAAMRTTTHIPRISAVRTLDMAFGYQEWTVTTDAGDRGFRVQEREDIRFLHDGRYTVKDADGNIYELPPLETLDPLSRRLLQPLL